MLAGRVRKALRRWHPRFEREGVGAFRLYDRDIPEVRAVVDWYEGHLVVGEYARRQTAAAGDWLRTVAMMTADALGVPPAHVHLKRRRTRPQGGARYRSAGRGPGALAVRERGLRFRVNLEDYVDTGLFPDHRETRARVRRGAEGRSVLNLFAYTGTFSAVALAGGAAHVTSVDLSRTYLAWAQANLRANRLPLERHEPAREDAFAFLAQAARHGRRWDLVIVDPPSFSTAGGPEGRGFDVRRDHPALLERVRRVVSADGVVIFSTNHQRFLPALAGLDFDAQETTEETVPPDFRNRGVHRSWRLEPR
jgi:23S rRNA (cytosine1962-C5)-methyltransferase